MCRTGWENDGLGGKCLLNKLEYLGSDPQDIPKCRIGVAAHLQFPPQIPRGNQLVRLILSASSCFD